MGNYAMIEGKKVELSDETIESLKKALIPEETYAVGDILVNDCRYGQDRVMVVSSGGHKKEFGLVVLEGSTNEPAGIFWNWKMCPTKNTYKITKAEMSKLTNINWEKETK